MHYQLQIDEYKQDALELIKQGWVDMDKINQKNITSEPKNHNLYFRVWSNIETS